MYLSKITLHTSELAPAQLLQMVERGEYAMHQWLWELFPGMAERTFLYRREELQGAFRFYVLSQSEPKSHTFFILETRLFQPQLRVGQRLSFNLRANPVVCKGGKRHDLLMDVKQQLRDQLDPRAIWPHQAQAACDWLTRQGEQSGFSLEGVEVGVYRQQQMVGGKSKSYIRFSSVDYTGVLVVTDPVGLIARLAQGFGKSRAFGCGLMLIKPETER
ncbi:type I-E CRISPR-associated protein Cas6/Cse3/CasE [Scandinavium lactucae]|uniref:Type I-E CRISPR-associated protein Cas6/Cse3/CasE n=1 Tax=Scandinavium lactucae TaxID=3095028 RepID=A0ABU4QSF0_9ENTR|nr:MULTISPECIES: type I-E CRISPR-associated protein Cas6/Cse3/CasE [unclassified Scandinavium]MDX6041740.1 type I-E CRISPR-associated protein Cas6/Cse3/CasE [Scandinavium sp. V105_6]MDX6051347.1 type I-E CRISPR-associated protein Cas6/Cse3/CasE [Scandinavium sp. V105_1]